jgi:diguanylate cyclase
MPGAIRHIEASVRQYATDHETSAGPSRFLLALATPPGYHFRSDTAIPIPGTMANQHGNPMTAALRAIFIPRDLDQALRLKRFLIGTVTYLMNASFVFVCWWMGYFSGQVVAGYLSLLLANNVLVFLLLRTGVNRRFADPSLTFFQMALGTLSGLYLMYFARDFRSVFVLLGVSMYIFGMFRFKTRDFVYLTAFLLSGYALLIYALHQFRPDETKLGLETVQWMATLVTLAQFTILAGYIGGLRRKVRENNIALGERNAQLEAALQRISDMAIRDELTGTYNRRYLMERIAEEAQRCVRNGSVFSICVMDIDFFKKVNDTYGHLAGDVILRSVALCASSALRQTDFFGRFGGEEFLMVMTDTPADGALICAERVRKNIEQLQFPDIGGDLKVSISIGIAEHIRNSDPTETFKRSDSALYLAKERGRNKCVVA